MDSVMNVFLFPTEVPLPYLCRYIAVFLFIFFEQYLFLFRRMWTLFPSLEAELYFTFIPLIRNIKLWEGKPTNSV